MNYLLVMPKSLGAIEHFNIFPIGLAYVSASLKDGGYNVFTANLDCLEGDTHSSLVKLLTMNNIDVVCTGGLSRDCHKLKEVVEAARRINPRIISVVGGGIISSDPHVAMQVLGADIGVIGEGEITMCELADALDSGRSYGDIPGLIFKNDDNGLTITSSRTEITDIDSIPFPDFDGFDYGRWARSTGSGLVLTDRSCPFRCTFCFHPTGEKYRHRSFDSIFKEIDFQIDHYNLKCFGFTSELFSTNRQRVVEFCQRIKDYNVSWSCCLRVCDVDADMLRLMKTAGCVNVVFGLESADDSILKSMRKGVTVKQISRALELTYEADLMIEGGFIFGDIAETMETVGNTLGFWHRHNDMHYLNLSMISVFPGSFLYKQACRNGIISDKVKFLQDGCPLVNVSTLSEHEYLGLRSKIAELRLHPHVPAESLHIESIEPSGECDTEFTCRKCGNRSKAHAWFWFGKETRCPSCGLINFIDPFQNALHCPEAFAAQVPNDLGALWGAGGIYYKLMQKYGMLSSERLLLIDANPSQQGLRMCGKEIHSPDIILQKDIKTIIVTALSRKNEIHATLHEKYPSVERILIPAFDITNEGIVPVLERM
jgi:radical SAM superfamily enzyme YgiQ (UPF0313 family)